MSVINQLLKDLEQRRAQGFDDKGSILGDLATGDLQSAHGRGVKLIILLLLIMLVLLAWLVWERFNTAPVKLTDMTAQAPVQVIQAPISKQVIKPASISAPQPVEPNPRPNPA